MATSPPTIFSESVTILLDTMLEMPHSTLGAVVVADSVVVVVVVVVDVDVVVIVVVVVVVDTVVISELCGVAQQRVKSPSSNPHGDLMAANRYLRSDLVTPYLMMAFSTGLQSLWTMNWQEPCSLNGV